MFCNIFFLSIICLSTFWVSIKEQKFLILTKCSLSIFNGFKLFIKSLYNLKSQRFSHVYSKVFSLILGSNVHSMLIYLDSSFISFFFFLPFRIIHISHSYDSLYTSSYEDLFEICLDTVFTGFHGNTFTL